MSVNILLADDHKMIREGLKQLLEMYDDIKVVGEAGDGFECLNLADKNVWNNYFLFILIYFFWILICLILTDFRCLT